MKLRKKMLAIIGMTIIVLLVVAYPLVNIWMTENYRGLENMDVINEVTHTRDAISFDMASLHGTAIDYAGWDDTYAFVQGAAPGYIESNFVNSTFINQRLNLIYVTDSNDQVCYAGFFTGEGEIDTAIPEAITAELQPGSPILMAGADHETTGFISTPDGLFMISACPVLKSDLTGPRMGTLVMGRYFDDDEISEIESIAGRHVSLMPWSQDAGAPTGSNVGIKARGDNQIDGNTTMYDVYGKPVAILTVSLSRPIHAQGQQDLMVMTASVIAGIILFSLLIALLMERSIIAPVLRLSNGVARIGADQDPAGRVPVEGDDEITGLASAINGTLESLDQAGQKLHDSELRFRSLVEDISDMIWEMDINRRFTYVSPQSLDVMGYEPRDLLGKNPFLMMRKGEGERIVQIIGERIARGEMPVVIEMEFPRPDGSLTYLETSGTPIVSPAKQIIGYRGTIRNISERKRAEEALRQSEERLRLCAATAHFGTFDWDIASDVHVWSPETYDIYGIPQGTPLTLDFMKSLIYPEDRQDADLEAYLAPSGPGEYMMEYRIIRPSDREVHWVFIKARVIFSGEGPERRAVRVLGAIQDITERKQAEAKMLGSLQEKEVLLKEIHHRVKNNLQIISSLLSLQSENIDARDPAGTFRESQDRVRSMALIHEKLYQSRDLSHVDFAEYVSSLTAYLSRSYLTSHDVKIVVDIRDIFLGIDTAIPCGLIINELVSNSLKYAFPGGRSGEIRISLSSDGNMYTMIVADNGTGLPQGLDITKTRTLGLQLVNTLIGQLEGTIEVGSAEGTMIRITFPRNS